MVACAARRELRERERVHVIERCGDQIAVAREIGAQPRLHHPEMALMRQHDALGHARRAGRVEKHRGFARARNDCRERTFDPQNPRTPRRTRRSGRSSRTIGAAFGIAEHELRAGIPDDEIDRLARELEIDRHGDKSRTHDAEHRRRDIRRGWPKGSRHGRRAQVCAQRARGDARDEIASICRYVNSRGALRRRDR